MDCTALEALHYPSLRNSREYKYLARTCKGIKKPLEALVLVRVLRHGTCPRTSTCHTRYRPKATGENGLRTIFPYQSYMNDSARQKRDICAKRQSES